MCRRNDFESTVKITKMRSVLLFSGGKLSFGISNNFSHRDRKNVAYVISDQKDCEVCVLVVRVGRQLWINKAHL